MKKDDGEDINDFCNLVELIFDKDTFFTHNQNML
jgi:hypothetical protein